MTFREIYNLTYPIFTLLIVALSLLILNKLKKFNLFMNVNSNLIDKLTYVAISTTFFLYLFLVFLYIWFPSYWDHAETSIVSLGIKFAENKPLYPPVDDYSFSGLLYGPFLTELHALFQSGVSHYSVVTLSKIPGVLAFITSSAIFLRLLPNLSSRSYFFGIFIFGLLNFWTRTEPIILLLVALSMLIVIKNMSFSKYFLLGVIASCAFAIKFHAILYVIAAIIVSSKTLRFKKAEFFVFFLGLFISVALIFLPKQINIFNYLSYLGYATKHGVSPVVLISNFLFFILLNWFIWPNLSQIRKQDNLFLKVFSLMVLELITLIIGSKPGAGLHHLMPYIPISAYMFNLIHIDHKLNKKLLSAVNVSFVVIFLFVIFPVTINLIKFFTRNYSEMKAAYAELNDFGNKYGNLVLGAAGHDEYRYTFLRAVLEAKGTNQIDYSAYMDYKLSGLSDSPLVSALDNCVIKNIALPNLGSPFGIRSYYDGKPLFSDNVRSSFINHFSPAIRGSYFTVYKCSKN